MLGTTHQQFPASVYIAAKCFTHGYIYIYISLTHKPFSDITHMHTSLYMHTQVKDTQIHSTNIMVAVEVER